MVPDEARELAELERFEQRMAELLCADPRTVGDAVHAGDDALDTQVRRVAGDGARIAALLIARLRFERLIHGSRLAGRAFDDDAEAFSRSFRRYHVEVPPRATSTADEAVAYEAWLRAQG